ncbi:hypothetical protein C9374_014636 [Naegleria lovaniensis]|uniref:Protein kinase domain-containing protein n=1 Tax=Naegleria lovaniensis TaxID=51637 RepID=A0AA88GVL0_NAELO|nr:uncharacterized protein C9374_014636 [Naegleria lovaniensis]KAG2389236.1 hypothetical protein C9374_014636 [Naegleria lovaniensis]
MGTWSAPPNSSSMPLILYISSPESSNNQTRFSQNCTILEPCPTISDAFARLDFLRNHHEIEPHSEATFKLMNGGNYSSSCEMYSYSRQYHSHIRLEPMENTSEIFFDCGGRSLFSFFVVVKMTVNSVTIRNANLAYAVTISDATFYNCKLHDINYSVNSQVDLIQSLTFNKTRIYKMNLLGIFNLIVDHSHIIDATIYSSTTYPGNPGANITISHSLLQNVLYYSWTDAEGVDYNELFVMKNTVSESSSFAIKRFKSVQLKSVQFKDNSYMFQYFSLESSMMACHSTGSFNMQFEGIDQLVIEDSTFYNSNPDTSPYEALMKITNGYTAFMSSCRFENISQRAIVAKGVAFFTAEFVDFKNIDGGAIFVDTSTLTESSTNIGPSSFTNISHLHGNGAGICALSGDFVKIQATCSFNTALNGAGVYVEANTPVVDTSCVNNHAIQSGGCAYIKPLQILESGEGSGILASNNTALRGGALFYESPAENYSTIAFLRCYDNFASYSGGCIYSTKSMDFLPYSVEESGNGALSYGQFLGGPLYDIAYTFEIRYDEEHVVMFTSKDLLTLNIYPGQRIPSMNISIDTMNQYGQYDRVNVLQFPIAVVVHNSSDASTNIGNVQTSNFVIRDFSISIFSPTITVIAAQLLIEKNYPLDFTINVKGCPFGTRLIFLDSYGYTCATIHLEILIPIVATSGAALIVTSVFLLYVLIKCLRYFYRKMKILKQKESAEKYLEARIIDKQVIFSNDESTPLVINDSLDTKRDNSRTSSSSLVYSSSSLRPEIIKIEEIEIVKKIGEGTNGTVYHAKWKDNDVALKTIKFDDVADQEEFEREIALLSSVQHPSIVKMKGLTVSGSKTFMVQEYYPKGSLDKIIYNCKIGNEVLTLHTKLKTLIGVAKGMAYLHSLTPPIIHRDLKPGNILLDSSYEGHICDFGLCRVMGHSYTATKNIGTIFYMANEIINDSPGYNTKVDVFSFGIIMWELFFEENPYLNDKSLKIHKFHTNNPFSNKTSGSDENGVNILFKVMNGMRPIIPFTSNRVMSEFTNSSQHDLSTSFKTEAEVWIQEYIQPQNSHLSLATLMDICNEYINLMKQCWNENPSVRPTFVQIVNILETLSQHCSKEREDQQ